MKCQDINLFVSTRKKHNLKTHQQRSINENYHLDACHLRQNATIYVDKVSFGYVSSVKHYAKYCAYCGTAVLTDIEANLLQKKIASTKGENLIVQLTYLENMYKHQKETLPNLAIIKELKLLVKENPEASSYDIIQLFRTTKKKELKDIRSIEKPIVDEIINKLNSLLPLLPQQTHSKIKGLIKSPPDEVERLVNTLNIIRYTYPKKGIQLPESFISLCKYSTARYQELKERNKGYTYIETLIKSRPKSFIYRLIEPVIVTLEHIRPHSKEGKNSMYNFLPACSICNNKRGNVDFTKWFNLHPEIEKYIKRSLKELQKTFKSLPYPSKEILNYIQEVIKSLSQESKGCLNVNI